MSDIDLASIAPYTEEQALEAFARVARNPLLPFISKILFPKESMWTLRHLLKEIKSIDEFQELVMGKIVDSVIANSSSGFTFSGIENLGDGKKKFLAVSNHRDIVLDPALMQWTLYKNGIPLTENCVGSNLIEGNKVVADLLRSNRMIKVIRGISAREMYLSSKLLSGYIRDTVVSGRSSVWIAQREGRTKNGLDTTEQGVLKMFDMSGEKSFQENFSELNIIPMSISYEYESCDILKARELLISRGQKYVKGKREDVHSILTGIKQYKGGMHLSIDKPLSDDEIIIASTCNKNDRYQSIRHTLDVRIIRGYKLWKTNYMGYDLMNGTTKYSDYYSKEDLEAFKDYTEKRLNEVERKLDRDALRTIFYQIYGNPVLSKEEV